MAELPLIPGTLAQDCYPASAQAFYEEMFERGHAVSDDVVGLLIQDETPDPEDQDKGWIPTSGGVPIYPGYVFVWHNALGHWVSRHRIAASDASRLIYVGAEASIETYDGGDADAPGPGSGPMWEIDTAFAGRVPISVGAIPGSSPAASIDAPLDTQDSEGNSGEYEHTLTPAELQHMHGVGADPNDTGGSNDDPAVQLHRAWDSGVDTYVTSRNNMSDLTGTGYQDGASISEGIFATTKALTDPDTANTGHNNMQPYIGVYFLKRTSRQFIVAA